MRLVLSGGGTGGHILPNIALIHELRDRASRKSTRLELLYIGTSKGMERQLMREIGVPYVGIMSGKLRRYFSFQNLVDCFKVPIGLVQAIFALQRFRPRAVFCKGGYVCLPVAAAARILGIPVILHEADVTPGLANRLSARFASTICVAHEETRQYFPQKDVIVTGNPVRRDLALGNREEGLRISGFHGQKKILLCMGGSLGANFINQLVWRNLPALLERFQIIHVCGQGKIKSQPELLALVPTSHHRLLDHYRQFAFVGPELKHFYAMSDVIVARAGALTLAEIAFFEKPALLVPLPRSASRGDQIENADIFAQHHPCAVLQQETLEQADGVQEFFTALESLMKKHYNRHESSSRFAALEKITSLLETA